ncbi:hypothetical protein [Candidatus Gillettellia adelgis]
MGINLHLKASRIQEGCYAPTLQNTSTHLQHPLLTTIKGCAFPQNKNPRQYLQLVEVIGSAIIVHVLYAIYL